MSNPYNIPILRFGSAYSSLDRTDLKDCRRGDVLATVSQANSGLITRDLNQVSRLTSEAFKAPIEDLLAAFSKAAEHFLNTDLSLGEDRMQSPVEYVRMLSASCGLPQTLCRANMQKIAHVMKTMPMILKGLTRDLDLSVIDHGMTEQNGTPLRYVRSAKVLGAILPNNSPGVNNLWLPATALKVPVALKPGKQDPWTPMRLIQSLLRAGLSEQAFGFYPAGHDAAQRIMEGSGRAMIFGDATTVARYANDPAVSVHGPGYSKVIVGDDYVDNIDLITGIIVDSIALNGGRSCINASTIIVPRNGAAIAESVARRLARLIPRPLDDADATLAGFMASSMGEAINTMIDDALKAPGAEDVTARYRDGDRLKVLEGLTYLCPTLVYCTDPNHSLAKTEYMFPFSSLVEIPQEDVLNWIGPTLTATLISDSPSLKQRALECSYIARLNLGLIPTSSVEWDQPHEGNLFEFLYQRRAIQGVL
ncbi:MAG: aldehyde dehydrogenase family protein [Verrucomicrobia bacterium]|nr:aldehyde dehydrogenase family protein [Verrucomicrobiota bacterium]